jgi:hypothetical protein
MRSTRWVIGVLATAVVVVAVGWALFVPIADSLATHDVGRVTGALRTLRLQTARDAARGRLLTYGAGLFAVGALVFTARNFSLSCEGHVTDRCTKAIEQLALTSWMCVSAASTPWRASPATLPEITRR